MLELQFEAPRQITATRDLLHTGGNTGVIESWRRHDNTVHPHSSLGYQPPAPEVLVPASKLAPRPTLDKHHTRMNHMGQASGTLQLFRTGSSDWTAAPMLVALSAVSTDVPLKTLKTTPNELNPVPHDMSNRR